MKTYHSEEHKRMLPHHAHIQLYMYLSYIHDASFFYKMKKVEILKRSFFCVLAYKIYFITFSLKPLDIEFMKRLHNKVWTLPSFHLLMYLW